MVDSIQARSSIPLPNTQTGDAFRDPLPVNSRKDVEKVDTRAADTKQNEGIDRFEDYLNQSGVTTLEKSQTSSRFDPVADIMAGSVYAQPGGKAPI